MAEQKQDLAFAIAKVLLGILLFLISCGFCLLILLIWRDFGDEMSVSRFLREIFLMLVFVFFATLGVDLLRSGAKTLFKHFWN